MFLLIGPSLSGKTTFVLQHITKNKIHTIQKTLDIKFYNYKGITLVDTPSIEHHNIEYLIQSSITIAKQKECTIIFFIKQFYDKKSIITSLNEITSKYPQHKVIIYDPSYYLDITHNLSVKYNAIQLLNCIATRKYYNQNHKIEKSLILIGITNVGKTSIINKLLGNNIFRISSEKHTTRELLKAKIIIHTTTCELYDTFGLENNIKSSILKIHKLLKNISRVIIVMDNQTYTQQTYNYIVNFLNRNYINYTFLINKSDLLSKIDITNIKHFLTSKYKIYNEDIFFTNTQDTSLLFHTFENIININKQKINHTKLNMYIKRLYHPILFIREIENYENNIYKFNICFKNRNKAVNIKSTLKNIRNSIYKFLQHKNVAIVFSIKYKQQHEQGKKRINK